MILKLLFISLALLLAMALLSSFLNACRLAAVLSEVVAVELDLDKGDRGKFPKRRQGGGGWGTIGHGSTSDEPDR